MQWARETYAATHHCPLSPADLEANMRDLRALARDAQRSPERHRDERKRLAALVLALEDCGVATDRSPEAGDLYFLHFDDAARRTLEAAKGRVQELNADYPDHRPTEHDPAPLTAFLHRLVGVQFSKDYARTHFERLVAATVIALSTPDDRGYKNAFNQAKGRGVSLADARRVHRDRVRLALARIPQTQD
jgi:hypothetical protein